MQQIEKNNLYIAILVGKFLAGELTDEELMTLNVWLDRKKENRLWFEKITNKPYQSEKINKLASVPVKELWESMLIRKKQNTRRRLLKSWRYAAAVILFMIGIGGVLFWQTDHSAGKDEQVEHGISNSVLIMTDGSRIPLAELSEKTMKEKDGTRISFRGEHLLYEKNERDTIDEILYNELVIPRGEEYSLVLSDGTMIFLNADSKLRFPVRFVGSTREVELVGEGYFVVAENKDIPFIVKTTGMDVTVLGTEFNVNAYSEDVSTKVTLVNGLVKINAGEEERVIHPGERACFDRETDLLTIDSVDVSYDAAWKNGQLRFRGRSLADVMNVIARWYDVNVVFENDEVKKYHFGGNFDKYATLDMLLQAFESTGKVIIKRTGKTLYIRKK